MSITGPIRDMDRIIEVMHTAPVTLLTLATGPTQAPSSSKLAIDLIILAVLVIMRAGRIMSGGQDTGHGATVEGFGSTAGTL